MKFKYIALGVIVLALVGIYVAYRPQIHYYFYQKTVENDSELYQQQKDALKNDYMKAFENPDDATAILDLGAKQFGVKDYKSAAANFEKVLEKQPLNVVAYENLVRTYAYQKDYEKAETWAKKYLEKYPLSAESYSLMGELYGTFYTEREGELPTLYNTAYEKTKNPQFLLLQAGYYEKKGDFAKAVPLVEKWLTDPANSNVSNRAIIENLLKEYKTKAGQV